MKCALFGSPKESGNEVAGPSKQWNQLNNSHPAAINIGPKDFRTVRTGHRVITVAKLSNAWDADLCASLRLGVTTKSAPG
jgi:hypothetical protein